MRSPPQDLLLNCGKNSRKSVEVSEKNCLEIPESHDDPKEIPWAFFSDNPKDFPLFSYFWIKTVKIVRPRRATRVNTEHIPVLLQ